MTRPVRVFLTRPVQTLGGTVPVTARLVLHSQCGKGAVNLAFVNCPDRIAISGLRDGFRLRRRKHNDDSHCSTDASRS